jgi:hypothetical protein
VGSYFLRGAYKAGAAVSGDMSFLIRPESIGHFLYGMAGVDTVTPVPAQVGAYQHVFTPFAPSVSNELPWMTLLKNLAFMEAEQYTIVRSHPADGPVETAGCHGISFRLRHHPCRDFGSEFWYHRSHQ